MVVQQERNTTVRNPPAGQAEPSSCISEQFTNFCNLLCITRSTVLLHQMMVDMAVEA